MKREKKSKKLDLSNKNEHPHLKEHSKKKK